MKNYKLTFAYDGTNYRGWQKQGNTQNTIQYKLEALLSRLLEQDIEVAGAGRTDAGVHAAGQVCSFRAECSMETDELLEKIREYLPEDIGALSLEEAEPRFHARLNAKSKTYVYRIWNSSAPNVFERRYLYNFPANLNIELMQQALNYLVGTHDFRSFTSEKRVKKSTVRTIYSAECERFGDEVRITLTGDGFLYNMVRIIAGTAIEAGAGRLEPDSVPAILAGNNRSLAGPTAPARGLILKEVNY